MQTMNNTLSTYEAKTHFSSLIHRANLGEAFIVTSHGKPLARIVPLENVDVDMDKKARKLAAVARIQARFTDPTWPKISAEEVREWAHEGHRW